MLQVACAGPAHLNCTEIKFNEFFLRCVRCGGGGLFGVSERGGVIHKCVVCRKLRGNTETQKMADLPEEHLSVSPPFTHVGLDVFGPFSVSARRTRGGHAESERWGILFTCTSLQTVHIEIIDSLDTYSCINAIRRFFAIKDL